MRFDEIADGVFLCAYPVFKVNCVLVTGTDAAMIIDTLSTDEQATELYDAARQVTSQPLTLVNTHFHFDHTFGNATLAGESTPIWGHPDCARELTERGDHWKRVWQGEIDDEDLALAVGRVRIKAPNRLVDKSVQVDLGGRTAVISHHGRGHTDGDIVVRVGEILIAGDLVEQGAPPAFDDAYPLEWPDTLAALLREPFTKLVPGHGGPVEMAFVQQQHADLTRLDWLIRDGHRDGAPPERVAVASPLVGAFGEEGLYQSLLAVKRGYAQLDGA